MDADRRLMLTYQRQVFETMLDLTLEAERAAESDNVDAYVEAFEKMATMATIADFANGFHRLAEDARSEQRAAQVTSEDAALNTTATQTENDPTEREV